MKEKSRETLRLIKIKKEAQTKFKFKLEGIQRFNEIPKEIQLKL